MTLNTKFYLSIFSNKTINYKKFNTLMSDNQEQNAETKSPSRGFLFIMSGICLFILGILLLVTEIIKDMSVRHNTMILVTAIILSFVPLLFIFIPLGDIVKYICYGITFAVFIFSLVLFFYRNNVTYIFVDPSYKLKDSKGFFQNLKKTCFDHNTGVAVILDNSAGTFYNDELTKEAVKEGLNVNIMALAEDNKIILGESQAKLSELIAKHNESLKSNENKEKTDSKPADDNATDKNKEVEQPKENEQSKEEQPKEEQPVNKDSSPESGKALSETPKESKKPVYNVKSVRMSSNKPLTLIFVPLDKVNIAPVEYLTDSAKREADNIYSISK